MLIIIFGDVYIIFNKRIDEQKNLHTVSLVPTNLHIEFVF